MSRLRGLSLSWRVLVTGFLVILGTGYLMGALNAALSVGLSPADIAGHYRDQTLTHEEMAAVAESGFVEEEFSFDEPAPAEHGGHGEHDMGGVEGGEHGGGESITPQQMAQLAHVHLLGFSMILLSVGALACLSGFSEGVKTLLVGVLFLSLGLDIGGLFLVRFVSDSFAALTMVAGAGIGICLAVTALRVLWELWLAEPAG